MSIVHDLIAANRDGVRKGLPCFCTANAHVLRAVLDHAAETGFPTVIEATCNQVNQEGGYTGLTPAQFKAWLASLAADAGVPMDQIIVGGDHLGPNPWRDRPIDEAMDKARDLVKLYAEAGFTKLHLDASMACGGEPNPSFAQIAERAADLCAMAEAHAPDPSTLIYVIGTEVPIPGGEIDEPDALDVTSVDHFQRTLATHQEAWDARGLDDAWTRIVSVVTQPGVDFGHSSVYPFVPDRAQPLADAIVDQPGLTFEAHSTDYQSDEALAALVDAHFFFLKVGPELTFRFREAVWALAGLAAASEYAPPADVRAVLDQAMRDNPKHWQDYYRGAARDVEALKTFSYSDRIRYYWSEPNVAEALAALVSSLDAHPIPETAISQAVMGLPFGALTSDPNALITGHIQTSVRRYFHAAGHR
ncbi:MAG: class II D-tagatose-bisphosphate aldolase, non-catalytic subunit [Devosiaceae bacterium]|nr:class II D-tagatose-bisphosphate aldolase, non-catalytic subunit [Devosiaceae bacterium MH13]